MSTYTSANVWPVWTSTSYTTSTVSQSSDATSTWGGWVGCDYSNGTSATTSTITYTDSSAIWVYWAEEPTLKAISKEEQTANDERWAKEREESRKRAKKLEADKKAAEKKAKELLLDLIGEDELKVYEETGRLFVKGRKFDYIVNKGGYVQKVDKNKIIDLCVHIQNRFTYPETDNVVGMKLAIEGNEEEFLKIANHHSPRDIGELPRAACM